METCYGSKKPERQMKTPFQLVMLEKTYALEMYPSEATKAKLSETLGLTDRQLQMWFCNRRIKDKKEGTVNWTFGDGESLKPSKQELTVVDRGGGGGGSDHGSRSRSQIDYENVQTSQHTENCVKGEVGLQIDCETTPSHSEHKVGDEESGGNLERSRTSEEGDPFVHSGPETPNRYAFKMNGEGKVSQSSLHPMEFIAELHAMRVTRDNEVEVMRKRLDLEQKREERKSKKMYYMHLNTLLEKENLSQGDEDIKRHLMAMLYGK